ncbi:hypothetical protein MBLNU459_g6888t2 [Dothideomycetes sp. NU459]
MSSYDMAVALFVRGRRGDAVLMCKDLLDDETLSLYNHMKTVVLLASLTDDNEEKETCIAHAEDIYAALSHKDMESVEYAHALADWHLMFDIIKKVHAEQQNYTQQPVTPAYEADLSSALAETEIHDEPTAGGEDNDVDVVDWDKQYLAAVDHPASAPTAAAATATTTPASFWDGAQGHPGNQARPEHQQQHLTLAPQSTQAASQAGNADGTATDQPPRRHLTAMTTRDAIKMRQLRTSARSGTTASTQKLQGLRRKRH